MGNRRWEAQKNGGIQNLFRKSVKFWNFDKMFDASYFSSKITPTARILHFMSYFSLIPDPILMYSTNVKDSENADR